MCSLAIPDKSGNKVKHGDGNFMLIAKLFTNARLFTIYEVNWQICHGKWFTIARLFTI